MSKLEANPTPSRSPWWILAAAAVVAVVIWGLEVTLHHPTPKAATRPAEAQSQPSQPSQPPPPPPGGAAPPSTAGHTVLDM